MATCPFCRSNVPDEAAVCRSCHAEKVTTFMGNLDRSVRSMQPVIGMCGFFGLLFGAGIGMGIGFQTVAFLGWTSGIITFLFVMFFPALLKTAIICRNSKVQWYR